MSSSTAAAAAPSAAPPERSALVAALAECRASFAYAGFFSLFINVLLLLPALYMLQVYDRVLSSGSESTLWMLTLIMVFLLVVMGGLEWVRSQILVSASHRLDALLAPRVFDAVFRQALHSGGRSATSQPLSDMLTLRQFLTGQGLFAFFDAPWMPIYLLVMFLFHPLVGWMAVASGAVLVGLALWNEWSTRDDLKAANRAALDNTQHTQRQLRNVDAIEAMGMLPRLRERWLSRQQEMLGAQVRASRRAGLIGNASKMFRVLIQSLVLGLGAWLALRHEISGGGVIAGSILLGRALAPLDLLINSWRGFSGAREAYRRLDALLGPAAAARAPMPLPAPTGALSLDKVVVAPAGVPAPVLRGISLNIEAGTQWAVIGPSASGKTTLVRALLGLIAPTSGSVRLDGAEMTQWDREALGAHIGYLPQDVELLEGSVSENIARFGPVDPQRVVAAAQAAGVHEIILGLPAGYDTVIAGDRMLSAGQRQRVALARALYGDPALVVLDEPNANLDQDGEAALFQALTALKAAGRTVVVVTHRRNLLEVIGNVIVLGEGQVLFQGPRERLVAEAQRSAAASIDPNNAASSRRSLMVALRPAGNARSA